MKINCVLRGVERGPTLVVTAHGRVFRFRATDTAVLCLSWNEVGLGSPAVLEHSGREVEWVLNGDAQRQFEIDEATEAAEAAEAADEADEAVIV